VRIQRQALLCIGAGQIARSKSCGVHLLGSRSWAWHLDHGQMQGSACPWRLDARQVRGGWRLEGHRDCRPNAEASAMVAHTMTHPEHLTRDGPVYAAGPMRGHVPSRGWNMASELRRREGTDSNSWQNLMAQLQSLISDVGLQACARWLGGRPYPPGRPVARPPGGRDRGVSSNALRSARPLASPATAGPPKRRAGCGTHRRRFRLGRTALPGFAGHSSRLGAPRTA